MSDERTKRARRFGEARKYYDTDNASEGRTREEKIAVVIIAENREKKKRVSYRIAGSNSSMNVRISFFFCYKSCAWRKDIISRNSFAFIPLRVNVAKRTITAAISYKVTSGELEKVNEHEALYTAIQRRDNDGAQSHFICVTPYFLSLRNITLDSIPVCILITEQKKK